ncbi:(Fe-S)-binding protein [Desulforhopalus vacuolatus]|uniref:sulfate reduction electron transfer complex DsrMKJOP subunit DsrK n=1 Tax=Desulforhopalus vacuolatus TaxID=40414 RepID=UPI001962F00E|nr:(Fe-S)-binding protein [Desulforhopalus vacuolatus]MBM9519935.1 (Fe-S)-binding protein [Desulforhopalus vacuolatus]
MSLPKLEELSQSVWQGPSLSTGAIPTKEWMDTPVTFKPGGYAYPAKKEKLEYLDSQPGLNFPFARIWSPEEDDWLLPDNWKDIILKGLAERLDKFRSLKIFMDCCVRCGACADKCHFFLGTGDPRNMPVMRAELLRSVYRGEFTLAGKILGRLAGGRKMTVGVLKEWFMYAYQCTECRRCSIFCPYGIDTAEITIILRELLYSVGIGINWVIEPVSNSTKTGNHMGLQPLPFRDNIAFLAEDVENLTGVKLDVSFNRKGAEILFVTPSADAFAEPGIYTCMGYLLLFNALGLDYTWSTYASEGGNFGLFTNNEAMKALNGKMYAEAERLGVKYILGGECGHMWRVVHQYMDTMNGKTPANMEVPVSPITGTVFNNAASTKVVHITEFTADLIKHNKLNFDTSRNSHVRATWHDSCNPARAMGIIEEPRYVLDHVVDKWWEMPENTIREQTFCCGSGTGLNTDEIMELRMRSGLPRANAVKHVVDQHAVNTLACICAIDRATLTSLVDYWTPGVTVCGLTELVANALVQKGENRVDMPEGLRTMV